MANYCWNYLIIQGDVSKLDATRLADSYPKILSYFFSMKSLDKEPVFLKPVKNALAMLADDSLAVNISTVSAVKPAPKLKKLLYKIYGATNLYDWLTDNWGTKWVNFEDLLYLDQENVICVYSSAWAPANFLYQQISKKHSLDITNYYLEPGMGFAGCFHVINGDVLEDIDYADIHKILDTPAGKYFQDLISM